MKAIELKQVKKSFGSTQVIHGVDLEIGQGEFVVFVGPSGCGKSTLLRMVAGLEDISAGEVLIDGEVVNDREPSARKLAMVFQSYALYPHMSVAGNMSFGLRMTGTGKSETQQRVAEAARILQLEPLLQRKPAQLSGGQRQRVAIGRAIVREPRAFLFDEPLSNLDAELRAQMRVEVAKLHQDLSATMIYVTHDQVEAMTLADRIVVLRAGCVEQVGRPVDLYSDPNNTFVAGFIGSPKMNFFGAIADAGGAIGLGGSKLTPKLSRSLAANQKVTIGIRPEHLDKTGSAVASVELKIDVIENLGGSSIVHGRICPDMPILVEQRGILSKKVGDKMRVGFDIADALVFDSEGQRLR